MIGAILRAFGCIEGKGDAEIIHRDKCATFASGTGIFLNLILFAAKLAAGLLAASVAVISDAFNNAADAGSSLVALIGFKMAAKAGDKEHPLGHGRMEYVSAFIVDMLIVLVGSELLKSSIKCIVSPQLPTVSLLTFAFLCVSILVKTWLFVFYRTVGKKINSVALVGAATDSISDVAATTLVLASALCGKYFGWKIDGIAGLVIAIFILFSGLKAAKQTIDLLLGAPPDKQFIADVYSFATRYPEVYGIHDVIVHDYGPGRRIVSFHAEVSADDDINAAHEAIDKMEEDMHAAFGCLVTVHMDPVFVKDERVNELKSFALSIVKKVDPSFTLHDFRVTLGERRKNLIFDLSVPIDSKRSLNEAKTAVVKAIHEARPDCYAVVKAEHPFV